MRVVYAVRAREDINGIYNNIAPHNPAAAPRVEDMIRAVCEGLADFPFASAPIDEANVRRVPLVRFPYTIFYRVDTLRGIVEIARVLHAARVRDLGKVPDDG